MTEELVVWFNPGCSKCRAALEILNEAGVAHRLRHYLDEPPTRAELEQVVARLGAPARAIARTNDRGWIAQGIVAADDDAVLDALAAHPEWIERPIAIRGHQAVVARPPERLRELL